MAGQDIKDLKKEIYLAMHKIQEMLEFTHDGFKNSKLSSLNRADELAKEIRAKEELLTAAIAKMASENQEARSLLTISCHIEELIMSIKRIVESSRTRIKEGLLFSDKAIAETDTLFVGASNILKMATNSAVTVSQETVHTILAESDAIEHMTSAFATAHEQRLVTGQCQPRSSTLYLTILYAFEDMSFHVKNAVKKLSP